MKWFKIYTNEAILSKTLNSDGEIDKLLNLRSAPFDIYWEFIAMVLYNFQTKLKKQPKLWLHHSSTSPTLISANMMLLIKTSHLRHKNTPTTILRIPILSAHKHLGRNQWAQCPDLRKTVQAHSKAASNATSITNTLKPVTKKFRISWNLSHLAQKKLKRIHLNTKFFKENSRDSTQLNKFWIPLTAESTRAKNKSSKSIFNSKRN